MNSNIDHPEHYGGDSTYETIKVIDAWELGFSLGNAVKYISRAGKKEGATKEEDLRKAVWYLNHEIGEDKPTGDVPVKMQKYKDACKGTVEIIEEYYCKKPDILPAYEQSERAYKAIHDILETMRENDIRVKICADVPESEQKWFVTSEQKCIKEIVRIVSNYKPHDSVWGADATVNSIIDVLKKRKLME